MSFQLCAISKIEGHKIQNKGAPIILDILDLMMKSKNKALGVPIISFLRKEAITC